MKRAASAMSPDAAPSAASAERSLVWAKALSPDAATTAIFTMTVRPWRCSARRGARAR